MAAARLSRGVQRHHGVDDVLQEVWLAVYMSIVHRGTFIAAGAGSFKRYITGIALNKISDACRRTKHLRALQVDVEPEHAAGNDPRYRAPDPLRGARLREMTALYEERLEQVEQPMRSYFQRVVLQGERTIDVAGTAGVCQRTVQRGVTEVSAIIERLIESRLN